MLLHDILPRHPRLVTAALWSDHQPPDTRLQHCSSLQRCLHKCPPTDNWDGSMQQACHHCHQDGQQSSSQLTKYGMLCFILSSYLKIYKYLFAPPSLAQPAPGPLRTTVMTATSVSTTTTQAGARHAFIHFYTFLDILSKLSPTDKCPPGQIFEVGSSDADTQQSSTHS